MPPIDIHYAAVLAAAASNMVIGTLWYSKVLFGKQWMTLIGKTEEQIKKGNPAKAMAGTAVAAFVMAYVMAHMVDFTRATTMSGGLQAGFWLWLGFVATVGTNSVFFEGKSWKLYALNMGYYLVSLLVMGAILAVWA
jgi:hypothetical protein